MKCLEMEKLNSLLFCAELKSENNMILSSMGVPKQQLGTFGPLILCDKFDKRSKDFISIKRNFSYGERDWRQ